MTVRTGFGLPGGFYVLAERVPYRMEGNQGRCPYPDLFRGSTFYLVAPGARWSRPPAGVELPRIEGETDRGAEESKALGRWIYEESPVARRHLIAQNREDQARCAAAFIAERAQEAFRARGRFTLALSGGSSVERAYRLLAEADLDWPRIFLFWGDERFIEPDTPYSNYRLAREALIDRLPSLPRENVFPVPVDAPTPIEGARRYSETLRSFFSLDRGELPRFDLAVNGMGPDGHTASVFPHAPSKPAQIARMAHAGRAPWIDRVTLSISVFNAARCVLFVAHGRDKAAMLRQVLEEPPNVKHWPASAVNPPGGEAVWLLEPEIASLLSS